VAQKCAVASPSVLCARSSLFVHVHANWLRVTWPPSLHRGFPSLTKPKRPCLLMPHPHPASLAPAADSLTSHVALLISSIVGILVTCEICHVSSPALRHRQWRRQGGRGKLPPYGWTSKNYVIMCVLSLSWNFFVSHDKYMYIARPSSKEPR